jgi:hypothetical protein
VKGLGASAALFYAIHGVDRAAHGHWEDLFWACHVACLAIAAGCLADWPAASATGLSWLCFGIPMWIIDLATGGELIPSSVLTHVGGFVVGIVAIAKTGWRRGSWWKATAAASVLLLVTRLVTPPAANVNLVFAVWPGWERMFPSHAVYFALLLAANAMVSFLVEHAARGLALVARTRDRRSLA